MPYKMASAPHDPVAATRGAIARPRPKHRAAILDPEQFADLLLKIDQYAVRNIVVGSALKLMALLYPRSGELRQATWMEFDLQADVWTRLAARTKMRQTHIVPLSKQAKEILTNFLPITGPRGFVFPATGPSTNCFSENTMNIAMRRMGIGSDEHTSHGFRATASTLPNSTSRFSVDAIERSLAHQDKDAVRRTYAGGDSMIERKTMSQWWADELDRLRVGFTRR
jgi:integrase